MNKVVSARAVTIEVCFAFNRADISTLCSLVLNVLCVQGLLVLSLALGNVITGDVKEIPTSLPSELRDFLSK